MAQPERASEQPEELLYQQPAEWQDVTHILKAATLEWSRLDFNCLPLPACDVASLPNAAHVYPHVEMGMGHVILNSKLSLQEAMGAIEAMDPKMDAGVGIGQVLTTIEAMASNQLGSASTLTESTVLSIMDKLLCAELLFFDGFSLLQTLLSCHYLHDIEHIDHPALRVFAQILIRRVMLVREKIMQACVGDEEEFYPYLFGFSPAPLPDDKKLIASAKEQEAKSKDGPLATRIKLNRLLLEIHLISDKATKEFNQAISSMSEMAQMLRGASELMQSLLSSHPEPDDSDAYFSPSLWKRFATTAPPRPLQWPKFSDSFAAWRRHLVSMSTICAELPLCDSLSALYTLADEIVLAKSDLVARATLVNLSVSSMRVLVQKGAPLTEWVQLETQRFGVPKTAITPDCHDFLVYGARGAIRRLRALLANRARTRRRLVHCFEDSSILVTDGETLDDRQIPIALRGVEDGPRFLSRWALDWTLDEMQQWLLTGFELNLYEQYEFPIVWWYLDSLGASRLQNQMAVLRFNENQRQKLKAMRDRRNRTAQAPPTNITPTYHMHELEAQFSFFRAMVFMSAILVSSKKLDTEPGESLGTAEARYYRRLAPFMRLTNPVMANFRSFQKSFAEELVKVPVPELTKRALQHFSDCQAAIGKLVNFADPKPSALQTAGWKKILRVCVTNGLKLGTWRSESTSRVDFDFSVHPHYPLVEFVAAK